nr:MAG TPA: hypothetical protein [Caudoviricetes sp.]DAQ52780.1 MAG TPA: hypothetical protein [Caudoviricetes sp.]
MAIFFAFTSEGLVFRAFQQLIVDLSIPSSRPTCAGVLFAEAQSATKLS